MWRSVAALAFAIVLLAPVAFAADPAPATPRTDGVRYLYLIRHGLYDRVEAPDDVSHNGLNALGREQATLTGRRLASLPVKFGAFVTSDYLRARQTAEGIGRSLKRAADVDSLIHECAPPSEHAGSDSTEALACESNLNAAWAKYARPSPAADTHDLFVCHGNVIRWFVSHTLIDGGRAWRRMDVGNGSLTVIAIRPDATSRLVMFSDVGHLPLAKQSWAGKGAGWGTPPKR